jgi:DNA invertase Pin-like site-specific DNA recombinase
MIKAIFYTRTIGSQDKAIYAAHSVAEKANKLGINIIAAVTDVAPGFNIDRPAVERLLQGIMTGEFSTLLVEDINSITTIKNDQAAFLELVDNIGGTVAVIKKGSVELIYPMDIDVDENDGTYLFDEDAGCNADKASQEMIEKKFGGIEHENC